MSLSKIISDYQSGKSISSLAKENNYTIDKIRWLLEKEGVLVPRKKAKCVLPEQEIINLYKQDVPINEIASQYNVSSFPIVSILKKYNIRKPNWLKYLPYQVVEKVLDRYYFQQIVNEEITQKNIMKRLNCGQSQVVSLCKYHNIQLNSSGVGKSLLNQRKAEYELTKENFVALYEKRRLPLDDIARLFGVSVGHLRKIVKDDWKYSLRKNYETNSSIQYLKLKNNPEKLNKLITDDQLTLQTIAERYDCCTDTVHKLAKRFDIPVPIKYRSSAEQEIEQFLRDLLPDDEIIICDRTLIYPQEIDIYLPKYNLAIEYNGLFWHSELNKSPTYHLDKTRACEDKGIRLIHIFEDEWREQNQKCKDTLKHFLGKSEKGTYARKTTIKEIPWSEAKMFLEQYHLLNAGSPGNYRIGAFDGDMLIGVMVFGKQNNERSPINAVELKRFVTNKKNNPGLGSKMFKYAIDQKRYQEVVAFVDRRWFTGLVKDHIGFEYVNETSPSLWWTDGIKRFHRRFKTKQQLINEMDDECEINHLTKVQLMKNIGFYRIYDAGKIKLQWTNKSKG